MNVATIRAGIQTRLATISGLNCYDSIPDQLTPPAAIVLPEDPFISYNEAMRKGLALLHFRITVLVSRSGTDGQDALDAFLSAGSGNTSSIIDAIEGGKTLGGVVDDTVVDDVRDYGETEVNGHAYWKADVILRVLSSRS